MNARPAAPGVTPGRRAAELFNHGLRIVLALGIVFAANVVLRDRFVRADLTKDQIHTISPATKSILSKLTDLVTIKAYVSEELPKAYAGVPRQIRDILDEYVIYGDGKVKVTFIDPQNDPAEAEIARQIGINPYPLQEIEADKARVLNCYLSLAIFFGAQQEHMNLLETGLSEYDITRSIKKVSVAELPKIGVIAPPPPPPNPNQNESPPVAFRVFQGLLETQYRVQRVETRSGIPVPEDIETLFVIRPTSLTPRDAFEIDQFVMRGGRAIFCLDGNEYQASGGGIKGSPITTGLADVLESYGVKQRPELVLDKRMNSLNVATRQGPIQVMQQVPYPFWIRIQRDTMSPDSPIVKNLDLVQLFWAQPIELLQEKLAGIQVTEILKTSPDSWLRSDTSSVNLDMSGAAYLPPAEKDRKPELLAALLVGKFQSAFTGKDVPLPAPPDDAGDHAGHDHGAGPGAPEFPPGLPPELRERLQQRGLAPTPNQPGGAPPNAPKAPPRSPAEGGTPPDKDTRELPPPAPPQDGGTPLPPAPVIPAPDEPAPEEGETLPAEPPREVITESPETRILVIGDSDFLADNFLDEHNRAFFLNTVDWFAQDEDMISIRSRGIADRKIEATDEKRRTVLKLLGTYAMPLLVAIFGFVYVTLRKRGRKSATPI